MYNIYRRTGGIVIVDSAFKIGRGAGECLIKSSQRDPLDTRALVNNRQATSVRQLSEWSMRVIEGQFPRVKDPLIFEECGEKKVILRLLTLLYNFQTSQVGMNQILNSFMENDSGYYVHDGITENANEYQSMGV